MRMFRYSKLRVLIAFGLIVGGQSYTMQKYGAYKNQSYVSTPEQLTITIELYEHERDYADLYYLFKQNSKNLGAWGYKEFFL